MQRLKQILNQSPLQQNGVALTIISTLINADRDDDIGHLCWKSSGLEGVAPPHHVQRSISFATGTQVHLHPS